jgi:hypothetical protein
MFKLEIDSVAYKAINYFILALSPFAAFFSSLRMIIVQSFIKKLDQNN